MKIGVAKRCISTDNPDVRLAGFGNPKRVFAGMHDDLWVRALALENGGKTVAFVTGDVLGFESARIEELRAPIAAKTGLSVNDILFNASHTHSAPNVMRGANPKIGAYLAEYADWFYDQVVEVLADACADLEEGTLEAGFADCYGVGINRRRMTTGRYEFAPYEAGLRRDEAAVLRAVCGGRVKAIVAKLTCHPSTIGFDYGSADWPGVARRILEERNPGATALYLQGCCGNIRVRTVQDPQNMDTTVFRGGTYDDIERFGALLADAAQSVLDGKMEPVAGAFSARKIRFDLPLQDKADRAVYAAKMEGDSLEADANRRYFENYDALPPALPYTLQRIDLGDTLTFVAMEGEVVAEYEYHMDGIFPERKVVTLGYSNGNPGYVCTAEMYQYGGYEPVGSADCYFLREGWRPENEAVFLENARRLN